MRCRTGPRRHPLAVGLGAALVLAWGCDGAPSGDEGDAPAPWALDPAPLVSLGVVDGAPEEVFSRIADVALLSDGGVAVADGSTATLRVFGPGGAFQGTMGGRGEGPGEFTRPGRVVALGADTLLVYDSQAYRLTTFTRTGQLVATVPMLAADGAPEVYLGRDGEGGHILAAIRPGPRDPSVVTPDLMDVAYYDAQGRRTRVAGTFPGMRRMGSPVPFSPHFLGGSVEGTVFVTDGLASRLTALSSAGPSDVALVRDPGTWERDAAFLRLDSQMEPGPMKEMLDRVRDSGAWDSIPRYADLVPDPGGTIWLKRYDPGFDSHWVLRRRTGGAWDVVRPDGGYLATVSVPDGFRLMSVRGDRVAGVATDEMGVERVLVFRLTRGAGSG